MLSTREKDNILEYSDLANKALEPSNNLERLIISKGLLKDMKVALI